MINKNKMSNYARSMVFPKPNYLYGLNCRSILNFIRPFRLMSKLPYNYGLRRISYPGRFSLIGGSLLSWCEYGTLDDLDEIKPFSWRGTYKSIGLDTYSSDTYSSICYRRKY